MEQLFSRYKCSFTDVWSDVRLCRFVVSIPQAYVSRRYEPKRLPRLALTDKIPTKARLGLKKVSPEKLYYWAVAYKARDVVDELSTGMLADHQENFVDETALRASIAALREHGQRPKGFLWNALACEWWLRQLREEA